MKLLNVKTRFRRMISENKMIFIRLKTRSTGPKKLCFFTPQTMINEVLILGSKTVKNVKIYPKTIEI